METEEEFFAPFTERLMLAYEECTLTLERTRTLSLDDIWEVAGNWSTSEDDREYVVRSLYHTIFVVPDGLINVLPPVLDYGEPQ